MSDEAHESFWEYQGRRRRQSQEAWATLEAAVPREAFVPDLIWIKDPGARGFVSLSRQDDPDAWAATVAADAPVVTQVDCGRVQPGQKGAVASSWVCAPSSAMDLIITMNVTGHLSEGGIEPRQHVLEIGTGTGWTAALLAYLLGPEASVVSVENDPTTAERARANLIAGGYEAQIVTGAVEAGYRQETPFGTVVSTAAVRGLVPRAWLLQLRDGGQLITPWGNDRVSGMILNVQKGYRSGRNNHTRSFGWMTSSPGWPWLGGHHDDTSGWRPSPEQIEEAEVAAIDLRAGDLERILDPNQARLFVGMSLRYGRLVDLRGRPCEPHHVMELIDEHSRSWARVEIAPRNPEEFVVRELGPEPLWPQIAKAYELWQEVDEPSPDDFGFRTGPGLQLIHLRSSDFQWELRQ